MSILAAPGTPIPETRGRLKPELDQLFREHSHMLYCTAYNMLGNTADAEDVLQTLFLRLLRREALPEMKSNPKGYLYRAAVNLSLNVIRKRMREELTGDPERLDALLEIHGRDPAEQAARRLTETIAELRSEDAQVLILRYVYKNTDAEIAKLLGVSRGAVAMRVFRSRRRLKRLMERENEAPTR